MGNSRRYGLVLFLTFILMGIPYVPTVSAGETQDVYLLESDSVHFNEVYVIMTGTLVPVSVTLTQVNDLNDSHMIAVHFQTDGHDLERVTSYIPSLDSTQELEVTEHVFFSSATTKLDIELEVLICNDDPCDMNKSIDDRFENGSHSNNSLTIDSNIPIVVRLQGMGMFPNEPPRFTFDLDESYAEDFGIWRLTVTGSEDELPIQAMNLCVNWVDSSGSSHKEVWNLANRTVYGFSPSNSNSRVTFPDYAPIVDGNAVATLGISDKIYILSKDDQGNTITDWGMSLVYNSSFGGAIFGSWGQGCSHDWDNDGASGSDAFPFDPSEQLDSDMDGVGDNADAFPNDPTETVDTDGDGVGDNSDAYPNDANRSSDSEDDSDDALPSIGVIASLSTIFLAAIVTGITNNRRIGKQT